MHLYESIVIYPFYCPSIPQAPFSTIMISIRMSYSSRLRVRKEFIKAAATILDCDLNRFVKSARIAPSDKADHNLHETIRFCTGRSGLASGRESGTVLFFCNSISFFPMPCASYQWISALHIVPSANLTVTFPFIFLQCPIP